jgi:AcrR family transcriptional regulator
MKDENQKELLLQAATALLEEAERPEKVTSRQIAERAGTNLAMINYYFGSKDTLVALAVSHLLDVSAELFQSPPGPAESPKERLRGIMLQICRRVVKYRRYTRLYVPHLLLEEEITLPQYILPEIRAHFGGSRDETVCRMIAYEMISFLQLAFYRADAFLRYDGLNLADEEAACRFVNLQLDLLLPEERKE